MNLQFAEFEVTLQVKGSTEKYVTDYCIGHLRDRGYSVREPSDTWETVKEFCERLDIHHDTLSHAITHPDCPPAELHRGGAGRLLKLKSNDAFESFVLRNVTRTGGTG